MSILKKYQTGNKLGTPFQNVLKKYDNLQPSDTLVGPNASDPREEFGYTSPANTALGEAAQKTYGDRFMSDIDPSEEKGARVWKKEDGGIMKYQTGTGSKGVSGNMPQPKMVGGMTEAERAILQSRIDAANKQNVNTFVGNPMDPEKQKGLTTQYTGNFADTGRSMTTSQWKAQQRHDPNTVNTTYSKSAYSGLEYGDKNNGFNVLDSGDDNKSFPITGYKSLTDESGKVLNVPQYGMAPEPVRRRYYETGSYADEGGGKDANRGNKPYWYINEKKEKVPMTQSRYEFRQRMNKRSQDQYDKELAAYNSRIQGMRDAGHFVDPNAVNTNQVASKNNGGILYNKNEIKKTGYMPNNNPNFLGTHTGK